MKILHKKQIFWLSVDVAGRENQLGDSQSPLALVSQQPKLAVKNRVIICVYCEEITPAVSSRVSRTPSVLVYMCRAWFCSSAS